MKTLTGHGAIILSIMYAALLIADHYNPTMDFVNNTVTKTLVLILCLFSVANAVFVISRERARVRRAERKKREARRNRRTGPKNRTA